MLYNELTIEFMRIKAMVFLILLGLTFFIQLLASVWFVMVETGKGKQAALKFKMLCSLIYIADALLCVAMENAHTHTYFILILCGMIISFIGDIVSSAKEDDNDTALFLTHSVSNFIYLGAYVWALRSLFHTELSKIALISVAIPVALILIPFTCKKNGRFKLTLIISIISTTLMFGGALYLGILCQNTGLPAMQSVSCALIMGAIAVSFSRLLHTRQQMSPPPTLKPQLPKYCAYFFGQMAIACSIILCGGLK